MDNELLRAALYYAELGYQVFPLIPGKKIPRTEHGHLEATTDASQIEKWWAEEPRANVGIRTEGMLVLDLDGADNPWLLEPEKMVTLQAMPRQRTPRGGFHFACRQPQGKAWRNTTAKLAPRVDTRANGGYICVWPSTNGNGSGYEWVPEYRLDCPISKLPEPPGWLCFMLDEIASGERFSFKAKELRPDEPIPEGKRDDALTSLGGWLNRAAFSEAAIFAALRVTNELRCKPPLPEKQVEKIARSVSRYEPDQAATIIAEGGILNPPSVPKIPHPGSFPLELLEVPGLISDVIALNRETAIYYQPVLALAGAIALVATITGRKIRDKLGTHTNLYAIGICNSGGGKEHARQLNKRILTLSGFSDDWLAPETIGSSQGIVHHMKKHPACLWQLDELGRFLRTTKSPERNPHLFNVISTLMRLYSSTGGVFVGDAVVDIDRVPRVDWPHCVIYGTTVPSHFYGALTAESISEGFVSRLLAFQSEGPRPERSRGDLTGSKDVPLPILEQVRAWKAAPGGGGNLQEKFPDPAVLPVDPAGEALFDQLEELTRREEAALLGNPAHRHLAAVWTRTFENARKLALVYAASGAGPSVQEVDRKAVAWGCRLAEHLTRVIVYAADTRMASTPLEGRVKAVLDSVVEAGKAGVPRNVLLREHRGLTARELDDLCSRLCAEGMVWTRKEATGGRAREVYVSMDWID